MLTRRLRVGLAAGSLAALVGLTGCSGGESAAGERQSPSASPTPSETETPTPSPTETPTPGVPEGVEITSPGAQLAFGDEATVLHESGKKRSVLALTVESAQRGRLEDFKGFDLDNAYKRNAAYYYVRVQVRNDGENPTGDLPVPLLGVSADNVLLQPVQFTSSFTTCPTERLPKNFRPGAEFETCLVFLSPDKGTLAGVSYRPTEDYLPIEWRGRVKPATRQGQGS